MHLRGELATDLRIACPCTEGFAFFFLDQVIKKIDELLAVALAESPSQELPA